MADNDNDDDRWNPGPVKYAKPRVTFTDGLRELRGKPPPGLPEDRTYVPSDMWWQDTLAMCHGDAAQAAQCMLEDIGRLTGLAIFYLGDVAVGRINESIARHESKFKARVVLD